MLKLLFWFLLLANSALLAYQQGYLNTLFPDGREPDRVAKQFNADKIKQVTASAAMAVPVVEKLPDPASVPASVPNPDPDPDSNALASVKKPNSVVCIEIGNFDAIDAKRFETQLASLSLGARLSKRHVQEKVRHMVFIPSQGSKEGADKKTGELRQLGVDDFYVIQEGSDLKWGISLGIFKSEEAARAQLEALNQKGVRSARLGLYATPSNKTIFQLRELDAHAKRRVDKIKVDFKGLETRNCDA